MARDRQSSVNGYVALLWHYQNAEYGSQEWRAKKNGRVVRGSKTNIEVALSTEMSTSRDQENPAHDDDPAALGIQDRNAKSNASRGLTKQTHRQQPNCQTWSKYKSLEDRS